MYILIKIILFILIVAYFSLTIGFGITNTHKIKYDENLFTRKVSHRRPTQSKQTPVLSPPLQQLSQPPLEPQQTTTPRADLNPIDLFHVIITSQVVAKTLRFVTVGISKRTAT